MIFCVEGFIYWRGSQNGSPLRCTYGDPVCSLTVATWLLSAFTVSLFLAAIKAAKEAVKVYSATQESLKTARRTLDFERLPLLGERTCRRIDHHSPEIEWWFSGETLERSETEIPDTDFNEPPQRHDFFNLGRAALINPIIGVQIKTSDDEPRQFTLELPSIPTDQDVHVTFHFAVGLGQVEVAFFEGTEDEQAGAIIRHSEDEDNFDPTKVRFYSQRRSTPPATLVSLAKIKLPSRGGEVPATEIVPEPPKLEHE